MPVPEISHLQSLILAALMDGELAGRQLREILAKQGEKKSGPAFYQLMARMEESNLVKGWYDQKVVEGQMIKERRYKILGSGVTVLNSVQDFYNSITARKMRFGMEGA